MNIERFSYYSLPSRSIMDTQKKENILLLDGGHKKTLAILRTLGKKGVYRIDVGASSKRAICFFSKYKGHKIYFPNPKTHPKKYQNAILKVITTQKYIAVIPTDYISFLLCSEIIDQINEHSYLRIASTSQFQKSSDKSQMITMCQSLDIPVPYTRFIRSENDVDGLKKQDIEVLKSSQERGTNFLSYPKSIDHAKQLASGFFEEYTDDLLLAQNKISGDGYGFFAFYKDGVCQRYFVHRRIREYPPSGGYSVAAEGIANDEVVEYGKQILDHLRWNGVAMVEFKHDERSDKMIFMELNPKYWGSVELSIVCGVDFPQMMIDDAKGISVQSEEGYEKRKFQWLLNGELFHFFERPSNIGAILADMQYSTTDLWWRDLLPNFYQIVNIPMHYWRKWRR